MEHDSASTTALEFTGVSALAKLLGLHESRERALKLIDFPGRTNAPVGIWPLFDLETRSARIAAMAYIEKLLKLEPSQLAWDSSFAQEELEVQILFRALRDPAAPAVRSFARNPGELRWLEADERKALYGAYLEYMDERSPLRKLRSAEEVEGLLAALGKDSNLQISLSSIERGSLHYALRYSAAKCMPLMRQQSLDSLLSSDSPTSPNRAPSGASPFPAETGRE